jgi:hypothetical protein
MTTALILDPRPPQLSRSHEDSLVATAPIGKLAGKIIGIRIDESWQSWNWISEDWARRMETSGAEIKFWRASKRVGERGLEVQRQLEEFISSVDFAIIGLCNCGGCTMQATSDVISLFEANVPAVLVSTAHFVSLAENLATGAGWPDMRIKTLPFPLETLPEADIHKIGDEQYEEMLDLMGVDR